MFCERMPREACIRTTTDERLREDWPVTAELLALLIEVTSVPAAGQELKKPITLPRPNDKREPARADDTPGGGTNRDAAFKKGVAVLAATSKAVSRR